jgi:excisionase family DNA binding protein
MSETNLNTEDAARYLGVSEASVRRWSDQGLLPVRRIGRRGARRFAQADLNRFRERDASTSPVHARADGVSIGSLWLPIHTHLATFYSTDAGRLRLTLPFLADGIKAGDTCFLVATGEMTGVYVRALEGAGVAVKEAIETGALSILPGVGPRVEGALAVWEEGFWSAVHKGARILRVAGEMDSEREVFESEAEMIAYEFGVSPLLERFPVVALCQYDVRLFNGAVILGALKAHPQLLGPRLADCLL